MRAIVPTKMMSDFRKKTVLESMLPKLVLLSDSLESLGVVTSVVRLHLYIESQPEGCNQKRYHALRCFSNDTFTEV